MSLIKKEQHALNGRRMAIVEKAWNKFDRDGSGTIDVADMRLVYDTARHPRVLDGTMSETMVRELFLNQFEPMESRDGKVTWDEFITYYTKVSKEVDAAREIDHDAYFELLITRAWKLDEDELPKLGKTRIVAQNLEKPLGLAATQRLDLIWPDPHNEGALIGYKAVVIPMFARKDLPDDIRGYFATQDETARFPHTYLPLQAAMLPPLDVVFEVEEGSGVFAGLQGVVVSNVDPAAFPDEIKEIVLPSTESRKLNVTFLQAEKKVNPHYKRSSEEYGVGSMKHCQQIHELKKKVWQGDAGGNVFAGRTGKFTRDFGAGSYRNSSLNIQAKTKPLPINQY